MGQEGVTRDIVTRVARDERGAKRRNVTARFGERSRTLGAGTGDKKLPS